MASEPPDITTLLKAWNDGDASALDRLTPLVYEELRRLAHRYMRHERAATRCKRRRWSTKRTCGWWT